MANPKGQAPPGPAEDGEERKAPDPLIPPSRWKPADLLEIYPRLEELDVEDIADHLLRSEERYVFEGLKTAIMGFERRLQNRIKLGRNPSLAPEVIPQIFLNLDSIYTLNRRFFGDLHELRMQPGGRQTLAAGAARLLVRYTPYFNVYGEYNTNAKQARQILVRSQLEQRAFARFLEMNELCAGRSLDYLLRLPVRRLAQYGRYFSAMLAKVAHQPDSPLYQDLTRATDTIAQQTEHIADFVQMAVRRAQVVQIQTVFFKNTVNLLSPQRYSVIGSVKNPVRLKTVQRSKMGGRRIFETFCFFLFNDCLLWGTEKTRLSGGAQEVLDITGLTVQELPRDTFASSHGGGGADDHFYLKVQNTLDSSKTNSVVIAFHNPHIMNKWKDALEQLVEQDMRESRKTIEILLQNEGGHRHVLKEMEMLSPEEFEKMILRKRFDKTKTMRKPWFTQAEYRQVQLMLAEAEKLRKEGQSFALASAPASGAAAASEAASSSSDASPASGEPTSPQFDDGSSPAAAPSSTSTATASSEAKPEVPGKSADGEDLTRELTRGGWTRKYDWKALAPLWFNADTGQSQYAEPPEWTNPNSKPAIPVAQLDLSPLDQPEFAVESLVQPHQSPLEQLQPPQQHPRRQTTADGRWEQVLDPESGFPFFHNSATGENSWDPPANWRQPSESIHNGGGIALNGGVLQPTPATQHRHEQSMSLPTLAATGTQITVSAPPPAPLAAGDSQSPQRQPQQQHSPAAAVPTTPRLTQPPTHLLLRTLSLMSLPGNISLGGGGVVGGGPAGASASPPLLQLGGSGNPRSAAGAGASSDSSGGNVNLTSAPMPSKPADLLSQIRSRGGQKPGGVDRGSGGDGGGKGASPPGQLPPKDSRPFAVKQLEEKFKRYHQLVENDDDEDEEWDDEFQD